MENVYQRYLNFGDFNRKNLNDNKTIKKLVNDEFRIKQQPQIKMNTQENKIDIPTVLRKREDKFDLGLTPKKENGPSDKIKAHFEEKDSSYISKNNSKIHHNTSSIVQRHTERRHFESEPKSNKIKNEGFKEELIVRKFQPQFSDYSKNVVDSVIKRELSSKSNRGRPIVYKSPESVFKNPLKKNETPDDNKKISAKNFNLKYKKDPIIGQKVKEKIENNNNNERNKYITTKPSYKDLIYRDVSIGVKKRPASHNTRNKNDSVINKRDAPIQNKINNIKDKKKKEESSEKNAVEGRLKLKENYSENKINKTNSTASIKIKHKNSSNLLTNHKCIEDKKLLNLNLENKDEEAIKQITYLTLENNKDKDKEKDKYPQKFKNEYDYPYYPKNMPLPAEKNFNLNIDFNQFDQFSPPSNQNLITKNINDIYEYNCTFNKSNDHSSKYGAVDYNYKKRKQEMENNQKKNHIFFQEYIGDNFTRRTNQNQREKDKSKDKDKEKLQKNYLISKLMKTTSDKVSLIDQNQNSKWK